MSHVCKSAPAVLSVLHLDRGMRLPDIQAALRSAGGDQFADGTVVWALGRLMAQRKIRRLWPGTYAKADPFAD